MASRMSAIWVPVCLFWRSSWIVFTEYSTFTSKFHWRRKGPHHLDIHTKRETCMFSPVHNLEKIIAKPAFCQSLFLRCTFELWGSPASYWSMEGACGSFSESMPPGGDMQYASKHLNRWRLQLRCLHGLKLPPGGEEGQILSVRQAGQIVLKWPPCKQSHGICVLSIIASRSCVVGCWKEYRIPRCLGAENKSSDTYVCCNSKSSSPRNLNTNKLQGGKDYMLYSLSE